ncbi:MAG: bacteriophage abortive infection AbiH family protein [Muribaculaceae bacterium]|nr:bacteriophage abortive infection AbiH family protein [Muribaculaceae bacterium]
MGTPHFDSNPSFPQTTIFIGNGFDLSLGLRSKYIDFFNHIDENGNKDYWPIHDSFSEEDQLYKALNGEYASFGKQKNLSEKSTWFDLEYELKKHAMRTSTQGVPYALDYEKSFVSDQKYFEEVRNGLMLYLKHEVKDWGEGRHTRAHKSSAYQLIYEICGRAEADPNIITFNYTNILSLLEKCEGNCTRKIHINANKIQHVHGSLLDDHIILGINEDKDVRKEYDFLFKSWDEHYNSHQVIDTLRNSEIIFFFGLSFDAIDSVYFVDFFKSIIKGTYDNHKKHIVICTYNEDSMREIYRQFFQMGISIMELKAHSDFNVLLTNPNNKWHPLKFENDKIAFWLYVWNDIKVDVH